MGRILSPSGAERVTGGGWSKRRVGIQLGKQAGSRYVQGRRKAEQRQHRNIMPPQFDLAEISITQAHAGGECPLGESPLFAILAKSRTQELQGWIQVRSPFSHGVPREESTE